MKQAAILQGQKTIKGEFKYIFTKYILAFAFKSNFKSINIYFTALNA